MQFMVLSHRRIEQFEEADFLSAFFLTRRTGLGSSTLMA